MMYVYTILSVVGWTWCGLFFVGYGIAIKRRARRDEVRGFEILPLAEKESKPNA